MQKQGSGGSNIKSKKEHIEKGNYRPSRHDNRLEDLLKPLDTIPECPPYFNKKQRQIWNEVCAEIQGLGVLASADRYLIQVFVSNWLTFDECEQHISEHGNMIIDADGIPIKNPAVAMRKDAEKTLITISSLYGFNARSRKGIKTDPPKPSDPLDDFNEN